MKEEWCLFQTSSAVNHVNQVIRGTREILIDSYGLPFIMKGCAIYYERCGRLCSSGP